MNCNQLGHPKNAEDEEQQLQAALAASREGTSVHEDQTSGSGAAAALDEASEPEPEADGLGAASCAPRCTRAWACQSGRMHQGVDGVDVAKDA